MAYKKLIKVSNVCQLLDKRKYKTETDRGVTFTNNGNGSITINGTPTGSYYSLYTITVELNRIIPGHKYAILGIVDHLSCMIIGNYTGGYIFKGSDNIYTLPEHEYTRFVYEIRANLGYTYSNVLVKPQLFDLTEMYGAGNEPVTVEEFRSKFPNDLYDYSPRCWATSYSRRLKVSNVCQLLDKRKYPATTTKEGITWTNNGDGTITANGTATAFTNILVDTVTPTIIKSGHKFLMLGCPLSNGNITTSKEYWMQEGYEFASDRGNGNIFTIKGNNINLRVYIQKDYTANNLTFKPQIFDLTEMYGAGHEPTTVKQFRADFPNELYDYKPYSIVPSYQRNLTCKTKNLFNPLGREDANPTGNWPITKYDVGNVIYRGFAYSGYYQLDETYKCDVTVSGTVINVVQKLRSYGIGYIVKCNPDTVYTLSYETNFSTIVSIFLDLEGNKLGNNWNRTFTTPNNAYYLLLSFASETAGTYFIKHLLLELGNTATDYVPYGHL